LRSTRKLEGGVRTEEVWDCRKAFLERSETVGGEEKGNASSHGAGRDQGIGQGQLKKIFGGDKSTFS